MLSFRQAEYVFIFKFSYVCICRMEQSLSLLEPYILSLWQLTVKENSINGSGVNQSLIEMHRYYSSLSPAFRMFYMLWISKNTVLLFPKNPSLHHPRAMFLGLTNEKIVLLSANSIRATVATENNKVWDVHWFLNWTMLGYCFFFFFFSSYLQCIVEKLILQLQL